MERKLFGKLEELEKTAAFVDVDGATGVNVKKTKCNFNYNNLKKKKVYIKKVFYNRITNIVLP